MQFQRVAVGAAAAALALAAPLAASSATAAGPTHPQFSKVQYNSPGKDSGSNGSLNAEYVVITNGTATAQKLSGWTVRDGHGHRYRFRHFKLGAGGSVTVHTGVGRNSSHDLYWNRKTYVWNNTAGEAILVGPHGHVWASCSWTGPGKGSIHC